MWCQVKRKLLFQSTKLEVLQWLSTHEVGHWLYSSWNSPLFWDIQFVIARHRVFHSLLIHAFMLSNLSNSIRLFCQTNLLFCSYEDLSFEWKVPVVLELWCIKMICSSEWIDVFHVLKCVCLFDSSFQIELLESFNIWLQTAELTLMLIPCVRYSILIFCFVLENKLNWNRPHRWPSPIYWV